MRKVGIFIVACFLSLGGIQTTWVTTHAVQKEHLEEAIARGIIECYALEGRYPQNVAYLEAHYSVVIDHKRYIIHYEIFAENIRPDFKVIERKEACL